MIEICLLFEYELIVSIFDKVMLILVKSSKLQELLPEQVKNRNFRFPLNFQLGGTHDQIQRATGLRFGLFIKVGLWATTHIALSQTAPTEYVRTSRVDPPGGTSTCLGAGPCVPLKQPRD